jgi:hypothetical protein
MRPIRSLFASAIAVFAAILLLIGTPARSEAQHYHWHGAHH